MSDDLPRDPDLDELADGVDADAVLHVEALDRETGERITGVGYADHLAEGLADARRLRQRGDEA